MTEAGGEVRLVDLVKRFEDVVAVDGINVEVPGGEFFSLLGPSGCGKTTTLRLIAGFERPTSGHVLLDGNDVAYTAAHKRNVNTVFQSYALFPHLDVAGNVAFGLRFKDAPKAERRRLVGEALELVQLEGLGKRKPGQLSGGQQQRVALARALVLNPSVLLLDEPLGALDAKLRKALQIELKALQEQVGITFIYVTHDQEEALTMSDRIAVMNDGKVAQVGRPEDLYDRPTSRFVAGFIGESNFLPAIVRGIEEDIVVAEYDGAIIRAMSPGRPAAGEKVVLTTRPERLRFADTASNPAIAQNRLNVTVTEAVFAGERCRYMLQAGDNAMVLKEPSSAAIRRRTVGERAEIAWSVADTILV